MNAKQDCLFTLVSDEAFDVLKLLGLPALVGNRFQRLDLLGIDEVGFKDLKERQIVSDSVLPSWIFYAPVA